MSLESTFERKYVQEAMGVDIVLCIYVFINTLYVFSTIRKVCQKIQFWISDFLDKNQWWYLY